MALNPNPRRNRHSLPKNYLDRAALKLWQLEDRLVPAGTITGTAFLDYNANGVFNTGNPTIQNQGTGGTQTVGVATDVGFGAGITVTAYDANNVVQGSATTIADGTYSLAVTGAGRYRLQFSGLPANAGTFYGPAGSSNRTSVLFVDDPNGGTTSNVNIGIVRSSAYTQNDPLLITQRYVFGAFNGVNGSVGSVQSFPYSAGRNIVDGVNGDGGTSVPAYQAPTNHAINIPFSQVGATWGLAEDENTARLFMAAYMKRHTDFGPNGTGAIYTANIPPQSQQNGNNVVTTANLYLDLNTATDLAGNFGLAGGTNYRTANHDFLTDGLSGNVGWDSVGKLGLGGLEISPDGRYMFTIGLNTRRLYVLDTSNLTVRSYAIPVFTDPTTGVTGVSANNPLGDLRPFAVSWHNGSLYVGAVNSAESTYASNDPAARGDSSRLRAYVFRFNLGSSPVGTGTGTFVDLAGTASTAPVLNMALNYARGYTHPGATAATTDDLQSEWLPWSPVYRNLNNPRDGAREAVYPQPMLTGIAFDAAGNMTLGFRDRAGDQFGAFTPADPNNPTNPMVGITAGDMLRAFGNSTAGWVLENNGSDPRAGSPGGSSATGVGNNQGPGGGEFYNGDYLVPGIFTGIQDHNETAVGGVLQLPGFPDALSTVFDPAMVSQRYNAGGVRWFANSGANAGTAVKAYELYQSDIIGATPPPLFAKANGIGDLIAYSNPIIEIGNRIWDDANANGIQDANENGIGGLQVLLLNSAGNAIGTTTTDTDGNYYFSNAPANSPAVPGKVYLSPEDSAPGNLSGFQAGRTYTVRIPVGQAPLTGMILTTLNAVVGGVIDPDSVDSDAVLNGTNADIAVAALALNESNHTYDAGFRTPPRLLSVGDFVWNDVNNDGQWQQGEAGISGVQVQLVDVTAGTTATTTTNAQGGYLFSGLQAGQYRIQIPFGQTNLAGFYSSTGAFTTNAGPFEPVVGDPANNFDHGTTNGALTFITGPLLTLALGGAPTGELAALTGDLGFPETGVNDTDSYRTQDFGFWQPVSIGDRVWVDANNNGIRETTEAALQGVTVQLLDSTNTVIASATTNAQGGYLFTYLRPGQYTVRLVRDAVLNGYTSSTGTIGSSTGPFEPVTGDPANDNDHGTQVTGFINGPQITASIGGATAVDPATIPAGLPFDPAGATSRYRNQDFGVFQPLVLGDFVWFDNNNNGSLDTGELPVVGITVELLNNAGTALLNAANQPITTTTDANGNYLFTNLVPGQYRVRITPPAGGYVSSTGRNGSQTGPFEPGVNDFTNNTDHGTQDTLVAGRIITGVVTLGNPGDAALNPDPFNGVANSGNLRQDFGLYRRVSIGDLVWEDVNNDGQRQASETPIAGVTVRLLDSTGAVVLGGANGTTPLTTTTDANGGYIFNDLIPGVYQVEVVIPTGYRSSSGLNGSASGPFEPVTGNPDNNFDHGTVQSGNLVVRGPQVNAQPGLAPTNDTDGPTLVDSAPNESSYRNQDFGFFRPLVLGDFVWFDTNNNGSLDTGENPAPGLVVELLNGAGTALLNSAGQPITQTTNAAGNYLFDNLTPGQYRVRITPPAGFVTSTGRNGSSTGPFEPGVNDFTNNTDHGSNDTLVTGRIITGVVTLGNPGDTTANPDNAGLGNLRQDFGLYQRVSLGDLVWEDANNDGQRQASETPIAGVTVRLLDGSGNPVLGGANGTTPLTATTDANGGYIFNNLIPGSYQVEVVIPTGYRSSTGTNGSATGNFEPVTGNPDNNLDHGTTQANNLVVRGPVVNAQPGQAPTNDTDGPTLVDSAPNESSYRNQDFGFFRPLVLGDFVWEDVNNNGSLDTGETPLANIPVQLLVGGTVIASTTTNSAGNYLFTNLIPGSYQVRITPPPGYRSSTGRNGSASGPFEPGVNDFTNNTDHGSISGTQIVTGTVVLGTPGNTTANPDSVNGIAGLGNLRQDFGLFRPLAIGDLVFRDVNNNGVFDNGTDTGIPGVTVRLLDSSNNVLGTMTTNAVGNYRFDLLSPGTYRVEIVAPSGLTTSTGNGFPAGTSGPYEPAPQNNNNSEDKGTLDTTSNTIRTLPVTLGLPGNTTQNPDETGLANLRQDFGLISPPTTPPPPSNPASISGFVYVDNNINGLRETGERPIGGTRIYLNGTTTTGTAIQLTTFTDTTGFYQFTNLAPGTYTVREEQPRGVFYDGLDTVGTVGGTVRGTGGNDILRSVTLNAGDAGIEYNFGEIEPASTFGHVWVDTNLNAIREAGEAPIPGTAVTISGTAFAGTSLARPLTAADVPNGITQFTNSEGRYDFAVLPPGLYNLQETQPVDFDDWMEQNASPYGASPTITNDLFTGVALTAGAPIQGAFNFGETLSSSDQPPNRSPQTPNDPTKRQFLGSTNTSTASAASNRPASFTSSTPVQPSPGINAASAFLPLQPRFSVATGTPTRPVYVAAASGQGITPMVRVFDYASGLEKFRFQAYESSYTGGVRTAVGDLNGDGTPDIVTSTGVGGGPRIRVFNGLNGSILQDYFAYESTYTGGVSLAVADVDGDGLADVIAGTDEGGGPRVRVFNGSTGAIIHDFFAFDSTQRGGVRVAAADFNNDGRAEIVTTTGAGVPTLVRVFDGSTLGLLSEFRPYGNAFTGGVYLAAGDFNGDGTPDIITGADAGGGPHVQVFSGLTASSIASFFALDSTFTGGVRVAAADLTGDGRVEIITGAGKGGGARVSIYSGPGINLVDDFFAYDIDHMGGVYLGAGASRTQVSTPSSSTPSSTGQLGNPGSLPGL